jgi:phospholipase A-2-activating protein
MFITENPYSAAQRFLENHNLPMAYLDQVVEFINKNTEGQSLGTSGGGSQYVDPYTGEHQVALGHLHTLNGFKVLPDIRQTKTRFQPVHVQPM